jgi:hypothetical protein
MAHANDGADGAVFGGVMQQFVDEGNEDGDALERKALGAEIARLDDLFKELGAQQKFKGPLGVGWLTESGASLDPILDPFATRGVRDVREFGGDGAAINASGPSRSSSGTPLGGRYWPKGSSVAWR